MICASLSDHTSDNPSPLARNLHKVQNPDWLLTRKQFGSGNWMIKWEDSIQSPLAGVHCGTGKFRSTSGSWKRLLVSVYIILHKIHKGPVQTCVVLESQVISCWQETDFLLAVAQELYYLLTKGLHSSLPCAWKQDYVKHVEHVISITQHRPLAAPCWLNCYIWIDTLASTVVRCFRWYSMLLVGERIMISQDH
jgi:hypothetical protein